MLLDVDMTALGRLLNPNKLKLQAKGVKSAQARVCNLGMLLVYGVRYGCVLIGVVLGALPTSDQSLVLFCFCFFVFFFLFRNRLPSSPDIPPCRAPPATLVDGIDHRMVSEAIIGSFLEATGAPADTAVVDLSIADLEAEPALKV